MISAVEYICIVIALYKFTLLLLLLLYQRNILFLTETVADETYECLT